MTNFYRSMKAFAIAYPLITEYNWLNLWLQQILPILLELDNGYIS